jgi:hypothetical protein
VVERTLEQAAGGTLQVLSDVIDIDRDARARAAAVIADLR